MIYKEYKNGVKLSTLGMGNMRLPILDGDNAKIDYEKGQAIIDQAMAAGINYYDTAYIYHGGKSEEFVGKALKKYPRDSYYVADKFNFQAQPDYKLQFPEQLERLQMDRIDFYLLHGIQDQFVDDILASGCVEYFRELQREGKIGFLGFSFHGKLASLKKMFDYYDGWDFVQIQLNYYDWYYESAKEQYEFLAEKDVAVMVMEPVHGGALSSLTPEADALFKAAEPEASVSSWAMRWVMSKPAVQVVLSGMSNQEQMTDNLKTFSEATEWTDEKEAIVKKAVEIYRPTVAVACTKCRYCVPNCPMGLEIPYLLSVYNNCKIGGAWRASCLNDLPEEKRPSACIGCGACTRHCPQSFSIPQYMKELAEIFAAL